MLFDMEKTTRRYRDYQDSKLWASKGGQNHWAGGATSCHPLASWLLADRPLCQAKIKSTVKAKSDVSIEAIQAYVWYDSNGYNFSYKIKVYVNIEA